MELDEVDKRIKNVIKQLQMEGFSKQIIAMCLLESKSSPIDTVEKGGKLQLSTIKRVAASMNRDVRFFFPDKDKNDPIATELEKAIDKYNSEYFESIVPTVREYVKNNAGKNMKTGQVKKTKAQQDRDDITTELMKYIDELDDDFII